MEWQGAALQCHVETLTHSVDRSEAFRWLAWDQIGCDVFCEKTEQEDREGGRDGKEERWREGGNSILDSFLRKSLFFVDPFLLMTSHHFSHAQTMSLYHWSMTSMPMAFWDSYLLQPTPGSVLCWVTIIVITSLHICSGIILSMYLGTPPCILLW